MKQRHIKRFQARQEKLIRWRGRPYSIAEAGTLAIEACQLGRFQSAADIYHLVLAQVPDYAEGHNNRGAILQILKQHADALVSFDKAIAIKPEYANAHFNRGITLKAMHRYADALASYDKTIALKPDHAEAHNNRGAILQETKRYDDALASYRQVITLRPDHAEAHNNLGVVLMNMGDMPAAEKMFLKAIDLKPDFADPWFNLANIRKYQDADNADVKNIHSLLNQPGVSPDDKEQLNFALGKIYDDGGHYDEAFKHYRQANASRNRKTAYNADEVVRKTDGIIELFSQEFLAQPFAFASDSQSPLFIVGLPRSGTTLMANILSNHRSIATAGELPSITDFAARLPELTGNGISYPQAAKHITPALASRLINDYEKRLRRDAGPDIPHVIDKNPLNFRHLGLISMLFPKARIIHCKRNPLDTCLSNYFQRFPLFMDYSFDLGNIGHFYQAYAKLMEHWRTIASLKMIEISYESMVLETEKMARMTLDFLGLEWDECCLAPHSNPYPVETASQWQVRQPIYLHSVGRWRHYEKHLAPLTDVLMSAGRITDSRPASAFSALDFRQLTTGAST